MSEHDKETMRASLLDAIWKGEEAFQVSCDDTIRRQSHARKVVTAVALHKEHEALLHKKLLDKFAQIDHEAAEERVKAAAARERYREQAAVARRELDKMCESDGNGKPALFGALQYFKNEFLADKLGFTETKDDATKTILEHETERQSLALSVDVAPNKHVLFGDISTKEDGDRADWQPSQPPVGFRSSLRGSKRHSVGESAATTPKRSRLSIEQVADSSPYFDKDQEIPNALQDGDDDDYGSEYGVATPVPRRDSKRASIAAITSPTAYQNGARSRRRSTKISTYSEQAYFKSIGI